MCRKLIDAMLRRELEETGTKQEETGVNETGPWSGPSVEEPRTVVLMVTILHFGGHMLIVTLPGHSGASSPGGYQGPVSFLLRYYPTTLSEFPPCLSAVQFPNQDSNWPPTPLFYLKDINLVLSRALLLFLRLSGGHGADSPANSHDGKCSGAGSVQLRYLWERTHSPRQMHPRVSGEQSLSHQLHIHGNSEIKGRLGPGLGSQGQGPWPCWNCMCSWETHCCLQEPWPLSG